jgi:organic hydroperoxide reductase OsmC/OhrA
MSMSEHHAVVRWSRGDHAFVDNRYSRVHEWRFDGGATVRASASPSVVRAPMSDATAVDPEEAFVAALSSCHMLWFLGLAAPRGVVVDAYEDDAVGYLERMEDGRSWLARVVLRPRLAFPEGRAPDRAVLDALHEEAHHQCFLASAVKCALTVEPVY